MANKSTAAAPKPLGLIGRCFIQWGNDGHWNFQGVIRGQPTSETVLIQYFDAFMGHPSTLSVIPLAGLFSRPWREPGSYILFDDDEHMRFWIERQAPANDEEWVREGVAA
jgi:hypothetical protein